MRISGLYLKNWVCYAGEHYLKLDAKMYALVAQLEGFSDRSNGLGKTALVESIAFALFNRHRFRTEDEFIAKGEKSAEVRLEFDDGSVVTRSRQLGKTTRLWFSVDGKDLYGPEAQAEIVRRVGLDEQDFCATCSFEQRQMARFILARPEDRMAMVSGWIGLEPLERAEAAAKDRAAALYAESDVLARGVDDTRARERDALGDFAIIGGGLGGKIAVLETDLADAKLLLEEARAARSAAEEVERAFVDAERYEHIVVEGKGLAAEATRLAGELATMAGPSAAHDSLVADVAQASRDVKSRRVIASGQFDGKCPIAEIACPAKDQINTGRDVAKKALDEAIERQRVVEEEWRASQVGLDSHAAIHASHLRADTRLQSARKAALDLRVGAKAAAGRIRPCMRDLVAAENYANNRVVEVERDLAGFKTRLATVERATAERSKLLDERVALDAQLAIAQAATKIFGKNGAQRRIAEAALSQIEATANDMLADAGIDLSVSIRWSREGKGLASVCETCGSAFPASARVKECARCREPRGPKLVQSLELVLSWRSGAAENMAGIFVQLAASAWLRSSRGSAWSTALLDEPTDALDRTHRLALMRATVGALSTCGFEQGFIVSHSRDVADSMPGRIEIVSDGVRSRVNVVA